MSDSKTIQWNNRLRQERIRRNWRQQDLADHLGTTILTIQRWEGGSHRPGVYFRTKLCALFGTSAEEFGLLQEEVHSSQRLETTITKPVAHAVWDVPYPRNPLFTGREEVLSYLHISLNQKPPTAWNQAWAITGLGGIGKTQLALEYAYRYGQDYHCVFWTDAATRELLQSGVMAIAERLQLNKQGAHDQQKVLQEVKQWLATHQQWLWILDNADDMVTVFEFMPTAYPGHLLLTSRAQAWGTVARCLEIGVMEEATSTVYLLRRAKLLAPEAFFDHVSKETRLTAQALVREMAALPLALDQAGAYIEEIGCSLSTYLDLYRTHRKDLLHRRGHAPTDHTKPVATTWSLSFEQIAQTHPAAADLLRLCAFLEADCIPEELLLQASAYFGGVLPQAASDTFHLNEAIEILRSYSLIQRAPAMNMLRIHRLVQAVLQDAMDEQEQTLWINRLLHALNALFPEDTYEGGGRCERLLPHVLLCAKSVTNQQGNQTLSDVLKKAADALSDRACYKQAEAVYQHALRLWEQMPETEAPHLVSILDGFALLCAQQGKYAQANLLYQRAIALQEQITGPEHPQVSTLLNGLALLFYRQGEYAQAEPLYQRALRIREQAWGPEHPLVGTLLNNLGLLYTEQGKYKQAEPLYQRALRIREQAWGPEHPRVTFSLIGLALLYTEQGRFEQAEQIGQRALRIREQTWGPEHPDVAIALYSLAHLSAEQGRFGQAGLLFQRALHIQEQVLGPDHPTLALTLNGLATSAREQGDYQQAEMLLWRAVRIQERAQGPRHPHAIFPLHGLANLSQRQGKERQAEGFYRQALQLSEQTLGREHARSAAILHDSAVLRATQDKCHEAVCLYQQALSIREQVLGREHPKTEATRHALTQLFQQMREIQAVMATRMHGHESESLLVCACGCGRKIDRSRSRGEPKRFFSHACQQRFYRHTLRQKRHT